jgi:anti-sigma B factor antagonist
MPFTFSRQERIGIIQVNDSLTAATADAFREQFAAFQHARKEVKNFVVDMSNCALLDSAGLGCLMAALKRASEHGGDVKIAALQVKPKAVFEITRAHNVFEVYSTVEEAVEATG